jgi:hypothetical protein
MRPHRKNANDSENLIKDKRACSDKQLKCWRMTVTPKQLRDALDKLAITKEQLATVLRIDEKTIRRWLNGQNKVPHSVEMHLNGIPLIKEIGRIRAP